jgi:hypothetical protein
MQPTHRGTLLLATLGLLAAGLILAACGGSSPPSDPAASAADSALKFSKCMREHGVKNFPNPEVSAGGIKLSFKGEGVKPQTMDSAQKACQHFQEEGEQGPELTPQEKVEKEEEVLKFAKCMREHGIEVEASVSGGGVKVGIHGGPGATGPNPNSPAFQAAQEACQSLLPGPKGKGGFSASSSTGGGPAKGGGPQSGPAIGMENHVGG